VFVKEIKDRGQLVGENVKKARKKHKSRLGSINPITKYPQSFLYHSKRNKQRPWLINEGNTSKKKKENENPRFRWLRKKQKCQKSEQINWDIKSVDEAQNRAFWGGWQTNTHTWRTYPR
jgi:hypothetical protein